MLPVQCSQVKTGKTCKHISRLKCWTGAHSEVKRHWMFVFLNNKIKLRPWGHRSVLPTRYISCYPRCDLLIINKACFQSWSTIKQMMQKHDLLLNNNGLSMEDARRLFFSSPLQFWVSKTGASLLGENSLVISVVHSVCPCWQATWSAVFPSWSCSSRLAPFSTRSFTTCVRFR